MIGQYIDNKYVLSLVGTIPLKLWTDAFGYYIIREYTLNALFKEVYSNSIAGLIPDNNLWKYLDK